MASQQAFAPDWGRFHAAIVSGTMQGEILVACERAWAWLELPAEDCARRIADTIRNEEAARWQLQALPFVRHRLMHEAGIHPNDNAPRAALSDSVATGQASAAELELSRHLNATLAIDRLVTERFPDAVLPPASSDGQREALLGRTPALTEAMHACDVARATPQGLALHAFAQGQPVPYLAYAPQLALGRLVEDHLAHNPHAPRLQRLVECDSADAHYEYVQKGLGVAWLPWSMVHADCKSGRLARAGSEQMEVRFDVRLYRPKRRLGPLAEALWQTVTLR